MKSSIFNLSPSTRYTLKVNEEESNSIKNIKKVNVDLENKTATIIVKQKVDNEVLKTTINNLGFEFVDAK